MILSVITAVHRMAGVDIQNPARFRAAKASRRKGHLGVASIYTGLFQPGPGFVVFHHPDHFRMVALTQVLLTKNQEIVLLSGKKSTPNGKLRRDRPPLQ